MQTKYSPVDCSFHDQLIEFANFKRIINIVVSTATGMETLKQVSIKDIYTSKNKEEFLVLENNLEIRLDNIIKVGDYTAPSSNYCSSN